METEKGKGLLKDIEALGDFQAYIVGGTPRDILMGNTSKDVDIATNCPEDVLRENFRTRDIGRSKEFGVLLLFYKGGAFEVAQFRLDGKYSDGRRPENVQIVRDFKDDVTRRDFTINSLGMNSKGEILDYCGGIADIDSRKVRAVGNPIDRFSEDHLRMVRAARFSAMEGFRIEKKTRRAIRRLFRLVNDVTPERLGNELVKAASKPGPQFARFILSLDDLKLLPQILPEVSAMKYFQHDLQHHPEGPTVFDHTIECLRVIENAPYLSKLAALFHDIGKCVCFQEDRYGWKMTYHKHEKYSEPLARDICNRLKFSHFDKSAILFAVLNHMKFHILLKMKPSKIARLVSSPYFDTLADVARADEFSRGEKFMYHGQFDRVIEKVHEIKDKWKSKMTSTGLKLVDGKRIIYLTGGQGKSIGDIKRAVEDRILDERLDPDDQGLIDKIILEETKKYLS